MNNYLVGLEGMQNILNDIEKPVKTFRKNDNRRILIMMVCADDGRH